MPAAPFSADDPDRAEADAVVVLRVPADPRYARVVRVAVSAYAVRLRMAPAAVEDLRLAVDEALILLMGPQELGGPTHAETETETETEDGGAAPTIVVTLDAAGDRPPVEVALQIVPAPDALEPDRSARSRFEEIVPPAVVVVELDQRGGRVALRHAG